VTDLADQLHIVFVGAHMPSEHDDWIVKVLKVRRDRVLRAFLWLKKNNPLYKDVELDQKALESVIVLQMHPACAKCWRISTTTFVSSATCRFPFSSVPRQPSSVRARESACLLIGFAAGQDEVAAKRLYDLCKSKLIPFAKARLGSVLKESVFASVFLCFPCDAFCSA